MFDLPAVTWSTTSRSGSHLWLAGAAVTVGLLLVIFGPVRSGRAQVAAFAVGGHIAGAYYFTSSTSFANPAVTTARTLTDTSAGITPASTPGFVVAELVGVGVAVVMVGWLFPDIDQVAVPHSTD